MMRVTKDNVTNLFAVRGFKLVYLERHKGPSGRGYYVTPFGSNTYEFVATSLKGCVERIAGGLYDRNMLLVTREKWGATNNECKRVVRGVKYIRHNGLFTPCVVRD